MNRVADGSNSIPALTISSASLIFGNVTVNTTSTQPLTLAYTGTASVTITSATLSGTGFAISGAMFPVTLNPDQLVKLNVQFDPTALGAASGRLTIQSDSKTNGTAVVNLSGTGTGAVVASPQLTISPASLAFGNVTVNKASTLPVTLTSTGTAPVTINSATLSGTGFTTSGAAFPVTLDPSLALTLEVQFDPATAGAVTDQLTIQSNSSTNGTVMVGLSGAGESASHNVTLTWNAPSRSADPVAGYNVYRSDGGKSAYRLLNSSVNTQTTYVDNNVQSSLTYDYIVKSVDPSGVESTASNEATATIP